MVRLVQVKKEQEQILFNLLQKYIYEMSVYYGESPDAQGIYPYPYLPYYFTEPARQAFFICDGDTRVGFTMINTHSFTDEKVDSCIAEFTIFPAYRKNGYALEAVRELTKLRPGTWQLKYLPKNKPGMLLWQKVKESYGGSETVLEDGEIVISFKAE